MRQVLIVALCSLSLAACLSFPAATTGGADAGATIDATGAGDGGGGDGSSADGGQDGATLPPPKAPCDPAEVPSPTGIFVSTAGDDLLGGTRAAPVKTIGKALSLAKTQGAADVYVDEGIYAEELTLQSATAIHGGWKAVGATWSKDCADGVSGLTVVRSTTARVVTVSGFTGTAGIDTLTLSTKGQADPSASSIAIFVSGASLTLLGVDVSAGIGGDGATPAAPAQAGNRACNGGSCSSGAAGGPATAGSLAAAGQFGPTGWVVALGSAGQAGSQGENGTAGGPGGEAEPCVQGCGSPPSCTAGPTGTSSAGRGKCGCGGLGGAPGAPGTSGGASVGVMIVGPGTLSTAHSNVTTGRGGNGAPGGPGGLGGAGTGGGTGDPGFCAGSCFYSAPSCFFSGTGLSGGSAGGPGGAGAQGGQGGGGAGGPAYGLVAIAGGALQVDPSVAFGTSPGGTGAGGAPDGLSATTLTLP